MSFIAISRSWTIETHSPQNVRSFSGQLRVKLDAFLQNVPEYLTVLRSSWADSSLRSKTRDRQANSGYSRQKATMTWAKFNQKIIFINVSVLSSLFAPQVTGRYSPQKVWWFSCPFHRKLHTFRWNLPGCFTVLRNGWADPIPSELLKKHDDRQANSSSGRQKANLTRAQI
jgi:hypothetical protein